uniref:Uncharacterized protein n=1 Tax=Octopus bimaculoides TaxID=37653 RepID=A0A0L8HAF3_OCTBM
MYFFKSYITRILISAIVLISILGLLVILFIAFSVKFEWRPYVWIKTRVIEWQSQEEYKNLPEA